ncbi:MAG: PBP1A family penicillin-binding protein [Clostridiaceae bacterium]
MKKVLKFIKYLFLSLLVAAFVSALGFSIYYLPKISALYVDANNKVAGIKDNTFRSSQTTLIYDNKNELLTKVKGIKDAYYLDYNEIPVNFSNAFIATEDKSFFSHIGVDIPANVRAAYELIKNKGNITQGASTITQQLSRNVFLTFQTSYKRKIEEIFISVLLEQKYDKQQILEFYLNSIYFANGEYGVEAASKKYFGKSASELNLAQIAFLSAIPNNPTLYDPLKHFDNTQKRKELILDNMKEQGCISDKEYQAAKNFEIQLSQEDVEKAEKHNYVDTYVLDDATTTLMKMKGFQFKYTFQDDNEKKKYEKEYEDEYSNCQKELYNGGYRIYTSIDMEKEETLTKAVDSTLSGFREKDKNGIYAFQGAATCIDNSTGKVVAIVGGRSQDLSGYTLNRAFQSYRQPGSTFKPIAVYAPAFENGYSPTSLVKDYKFNGGPKNDNNSYSGYIPIRYAVAQSKNTVAWQVFGAIGPEKGLSYIKKMNFSKIVAQDDTLSASLGGLTYGVTTVEMASAYSTLERDGKFYEPTCINKITDVNGNTLYDDSRQQVQIYTETAARTMTNVLESVMSYGTGSRVKLHNMPCAGKTGTTSGGKDGWFAGYTPYYTTVVWCGYDMPRETTDLYGSTYPGQIWNKYMQSIHANLTVKNFESCPGLGNEQYVMNNQIKQKNEKKTEVAPKEEELQNSGDTTAQTGKDDKTNSGDAGTQTDTNVNTPDDKGTKTPTEGSTGTGAGTGSDSNTVQAPAPVTPKTN